MSGKRVCHWIETATDHFQLGCLGDKITVHNQTRAFPVSATDPFPPGVYYRFCPFCGRQIEMHEPSEIQDFSGEFQEALEGTVTNEQAG